MVDAKTDYPAACNAVEKVLVHDSLVGPKLDKIQVHGHPFNIAASSIAVTGGACPAWAAASGPRASCACLVSLC